jgi:small subunit ribosomal protein S8
MLLSTDPISDMLTRIRNALAGGKAQVRVPFSTMKLHIAEQLVQHGFLQAAQTEGEGIAREVVITLSSDTHAPHINTIERVSKPGRRLYAKAGAIPRIMNGRGMLILSTSKGLMSDQQARQANIGGELICKVY